MADKIKKFFTKKKADAKFKLAGRGRRLNESSTTVVGPSKQQTQPAQRLEPSEATKQAAEAAMARLNSQKKDSTFNTSLAAIQAQVRRELEAEKKTESSGSSPPLTRKSVEREYDVETSPYLAVNGVYFRCPMISEEILSKEMWKVKIKEFLYEQLEEERGLTACLIIHSCNYSRMKVNDCVEVLCKYLENIIANPEETKFHKIRCSNVTFRDKVMPVLGATDLLFAAGFRQAQIELNSVMEDFWVFDIQNVEGITTLEFLKDALKSEDRIELELDRNIQVLFPTQAAKRVDLPQDFFSLTAEEMKKEQQLKSEALEKQMQLRTKAMREKEEQREIKKYKFALIRVRFPDGLYLQGTFSVYEKFSDVVDFILENLDNAVAPFILTSPSGHRFEETEYDSTLFVLKLVPATIITFQWDPLVADEMSRESNTFLKPEIMMLAQSF